MNNCGIYCLTNTSNGKKYIGQSRDLVKREKTHFWMLKKNRHPNVHLQRSFNKGNEFEFSVIEYCEPDECDDREIYWIDKYGTFRDGYNQCAGGNATVGYHFTDEQKAKISSANKGRKFDKEAIERRINSFKHHLATDPIFAAEYRKKLKERNKGNSWNRGRHHTEEEKKNLSEKLKGRYISPEQKQKLRELYSGEKSLTAKLTEKDVIEIRYRYLHGESQTEIAKDFPVTKQTVYDIVHNRRWKSLPNTLPELEALMT